MREIVFDTETTGMDPASGDRIVEIGAVELVNHVPTGRTLHLYLNPERDVPAEAVAVHGLSYEFLKGHPTFAEVVDKFVDFIADDILVAHNAEFDIKFVNAELRTLGFPAIAPRRVVDTVQIARRKFPGAPASLDALCRRFGVDLSERSLHGALLDSQLLAVVYLELLGGRQHGLGLDAPAAEKTAGDAAAPEIAAPRVARPPRSFAPTPEEAEAHAAMVEKLKNPIWKKLA
ncbi:MAG: DNA polymerase III subunit epsilon [Rhodospirillales bacterium]|nr:DNA polymerase III subunit epsilon [Rhodospirillales bacterium]USO06868.1 MAG: DNA polymerase III subunit epsilon [Rhodospirillales bacterium]